jgi:hypothetical protein
MITGHLNKLGSLLTASSSTCQAPSVTQNRSSFAPTTPLQTTSSSSNIQIQQQNNNNLGTSASTTTDGNVLRSRIAVDQHKRNVERNQSVTRTLLAVSVSFTVCWLPLYILNAIIDLNFLSAGSEGVIRVDIKTIYLLSAACHAIAMTSAPLNALLYGWYNPSINRELLTWNFWGWRRNHFDNEVESNRSPGRHRQNNRNKVVINDSKLEDSVMEGNKTTRGSNTNITNAQSTPIAVRSLRVHSRDFSQSNLQSSPNFI